jgi:arabinofuranosyltransferase
MLQIKRMLRQLGREVRKQPSRGLLMVLSPIAALAVILPNAWIADDAYISLRVAKNILLGYGPVWNIDDRVQVFTHPLWMAVLIFAQWLFPGNAAQAVIVLGIIFTLIALILFLRDIQVRWVMVLSVVLLLSSMPFVDYATSGLENPLLYILVILFAHEYLGKKRTFQLALFAGLAIFTRADAAALFIPAFIPLLMQHWRRREFWLDLLKGFSPLIVWELFSLFYFGYLLPNTDYAKLHTYIHPQVSGSHAYNYFANSLDWDKVTLPIIVAALIVADLNRRNRAHLYLTLGIALYLFAIYKAGGDYMSGRFFAVPFFLATYLVARWLQEPAPSPRFLKPAAAVALLLLAVITPLSPVTQPLTNLSNYVYGIVPNTPRDGIELLDTYHGLVSDEGEYYCPYMCLYNLANLPLNIYYKESQRIKHIPQVVEGSIGLAGYYADPKVHIVDEYALADPLLSHLPSNDAARQGHFDRQIPPGYLDSLKHHANLITNGCDHQLYRDIMPVATGKLFSLHRFKEIIKLNLGISDKHYQACAIKAGDLQ